jgi:hypothetical protein
MKDWGILFYNISEKLALAILVISMVIGGIKYRTFTKELKWFFYYLGFDLIIEILSRLLAEFGQHNLIVYPFYISGEFVLLSTMIIVGLKLPRKWFIPVGLITAYLLLESLFLWINNHNLSSGIGKTISQIIIVCMIGYYFIYTLKTFENKKSNSILLIYGFLFLNYTSSIFLYLLFDQLSTMSLSNASIVWGMNTALCALLYGVASYTFLKS